MGSGGLRVLGVTIALLCLVAAAFIPSAAEGKRKGGFKRSLTVKVKLPETGKIGYTHVVLKTRKARKKRRGGKRSAALAKRSKKPPLKLRIKNRKRLSSNVVVFARVSKLKRKSAKRSRGAKKRTRTVPNTLMVDIVVINRRTAKSSRARSSQGSGLQPGGTIPVGVRAGKGVSGMERKSTFSTQDVVASDITDGGLHRRACRNADDIVMEWFFPLFAKKDREERKAREFWEGADGALCDKEGRAWFEKWGADRPKRADEVPLPALSFSCASKITFAPADEFTTVITCDFAADLIAIQVLFGRRVDAFLPPAGGTCQVQTKGSVNDTVSCTGPFPPNTPVQVNIAPFPGPTSGMPVNIFGYIGGVEYGPFPGALP